MILLQNQTTNTDGSQTVKEIGLKNMRVLPGSNDRLVWVEGTFDGATVNLEIKPYQASAFDTEISFTEIGRQILTVPVYMNVRGAVTDAGSLTDITLGIS